MRFDVVTIFPELFAPHLNLGITRRAFESAQVDVRLWPLRDFADDTYRRVDDRPYGGGPGMVMLAEPLLRALAAISADRAETRPAVVHFTPTGRRIDQAVVQDFSAGPGAVLLCGRYEGIDQRLIDAHVTHELSLGDFVLSGGELPALALLDAVARLQDGVLNAPSSIDTLEIAPRPRSSPTGRRPSTWDISSWNSGSGWHALQRPEPWNSIQPFFSVAAGAANKHAMKRSHGVSSGICVRS